MMTTLSTNLLRVIQIIRDTLRVDEMSHSHFLLFEMLFLMLLDVKLFGTGQYKASKDTYFLITLIIQSNLGLKKALENRKMSHGGGGGKF